MGQKRDESFVERIIRSTNHCRIGLLAGYTTYRFVTIIKADLQVTLMTRDLGSESMLESDANVRDAINRGLMPGPRLYVATKPIASTASYEPKTENHIGGTCIPASADTADGPDELRKAVRRRLGFGADVIKVYVDYRRRIMRFPPKQQHPYISGIKFLPQNPNPDYVTFSDEELRAIKEEADRLQAPVVAHCHTQEGVDMACKAGFTSIEHGSQVQDLTVMKECDTLFVPTLALVEFVYPPKLKHCLSLVKKANDMGIRIAAGGDTGTFPHGENARELELLVKAGLSVEEVIQATTYRGWESCGGERCGRNFGWFDVGVAADLIALDKDPRDDPHAFREVSFVMKDAKVWKEDGHGVSMLDIGMPEEGSYLRHFGLPS